MKQKRIIITPKKSELKMEYIKDNMNIFNKTFKEFMHKKKENFKKMYNFNDRNEISVKLQRCSSSFDAFPQNMKSANIILNNIVLEELNEKKLDDLLLNSNSDSYSSIKSKGSKIMSAKSFITNKHERLISPLTPTNYYKLLLQYKYKYLRKSGSQLLFNRILRIKPKIRNNVLNNKIGGDSSTNHTNFNQNEKSLNILNIKRLFSPLEMSLRKNEENSDIFKFRKSKENHTDKNTKFRNNRYYTNSIKYRMIQYYNNCKNEKK